MEFELVVGMEIHAQLRTKTKLFCGCLNRFGDAPNANTCEVCLGHPGVLPVLNTAVVEKIIKAGLALNCSIDPLSQFARKNYFYPDLPKGYQISQFELPICSGGFLEVTDADKKLKKIRLRRIHIEEDAGKLMHEGIKDGSLVDFNRAGTPLMEIVTEPDFRSVEEVYDFLTQLRQIFRYLDVCDGNMEEGSLRCEPNISIRPKNSPELGVKVELKNINSFKAARKGIEFEFARQSKILNEGEKISQETRGWDENKNESFLMRTKEEAHDYRYFPDPDLPPLRVDDEWIEKVRRTMEELPRNKKERICREFKISDNDCDVICSEKAVAEFYEQTAKACGDGKQAANWVMGDVLRVLKTGGAINTFPITPSRLSGLIKLVADGKLSSSMGRQVFETMLTSSEDASTIMLSRGLGIVSDSTAIMKTIDEVISEFPEQVQQFLSGKDKIMAFLIGQAMRKMKGKADPTVMNRLMKERIETLRGKT